MTIKILVVDDDEMNRKILRNILEDGDFDVVEAEDGQEGLATLKQHPDVRIILLDRMMPNMNGMEFMKLFNENDTWKENIRVVMQTAATQPREVIEGNALGVYYYLTKPYDEQIVLSIIRSAMSDLDLV